MSLTEIQVEVANICQELAARESAINERERNLKKAYDERFTAATANLRWTCTQLRAEIADLRRELREREILSHLPPGGS